eukprot:CAMPEP_0118937910 /NCGR_PEP_ID=MMETSP1169-20130426/24174_1 /TAXON_ID=36882 /ORGANISM="Pyramimonas obovata, Strain CCMP722" /LENGTH=247 /DNA_ID=CAMNT_0006881679 /DNA_START=30 /DNA_END=774 /DNA_ORIENTATION=+
MEVDAPEPQDEGTDPAVADIPTKIVDHTIQVAVRCAVLYMDFEGRADSRSIKMILQHMAPLQLVLVHGTKETTEALRDTMTKTLAPAKVHAPAPLETIDCSSESAAYKVKLTEEVLATVELKTLEGEYEVGWVDGVLGPVLPGCRHVALLPPPIDTELPHQAALVGTLKLSDFKQTLAAAGVPAEFAGGVLLCGGMVTVRKDAGTQQLVLEGALSEDYYKISKSYTHNITYYETSHNSTSPMRAIGY